MLAEEKFPKSVRGVLWSYDINKIDFTLHKHLIISQVLNYGPKDATDWLFDKYRLDEIIKEAELIPVGQWDKKSLALWSLYLHIRPISRVEKVQNG